MFVLVFAGFSSFAVADQQGNMFFPFRPPPEAHKTPTPANTEQQDSMFMFPDHKPLTSAPGDTDSKDINSEQGFTAWPAAASHPYMRPSFQLRAGFMHSPFMSRLGHKIIRPTSKMLEIRPVFFSKPGTAYLELINNTNSSIQLKKIKIINKDSLFGVKQGAIPHDCKEIAIHKSCRIPFIATKRAYGNARLGVDYTDTKGASKTINTSINVARTQIELSGTSIHSANEIRLNPGKIGIQAINIMNSGAFAIQNIGIHITAPAGVKYSSNCSDGDVVDPENSCNVNFSIKDKQKVKWGASTDLRITGDNISTLMGRIVIDDGLVVKADTGLNDQNLQYHAVRIENTSPNIYTIKGMWLSGGYGIEICGISPATQCTLNSTCAIGQTLAAGGSCLVWLRAQTGASTRVQYETLNIEIISGTTTFVKNAKISK